MVLHRWGRCKQATNSVFGCENISNEHDCNGIFPHSAINYEGLVSYGGFFASTAAITSSKRRDALLEALEYQHMQQDDWWKHIELDFTDDHHNRWWERLSHKRRARWPLGQLWNCTDALPRVYLNEITDRDPEGRQMTKYAVLVRVLARELAEDQIAA